MSRVCVSWSGHPPCPLRSRVKKTNAARGNFYHFKRVVLQKMGCYIIAFIIHNCLFYWLLCCFLGWVVVPHAPHFFWVFLAKARRPQRDFFHLVCRWASFAVSFFKKWGVTLWLCLFLFG